MAGLTRRLALAALGLGLSAVFAAPALAQWTEWDAASELGWVQGDADAPLTVIEYFSPTCSHCREFAEDVMPAIERDYVATGKVKIILREWIRNDVDTTIISQARCLSAADGASYLHDVFARQDDIFTAANSGAIAKTLIEIGTPYGITDRAKFDACYKDMNTRFDMLAVSDSGEHYGVHATPTFVVNGEAYAATVPLMTEDGFAAFLDAELAKVATATN